MKWLLLSLLWLMLSINCHANNSDLAAETQAQIQHLQLELSALAKKQADTSSEVSKLQNRITNNGLALLFFAFFCAWWAKSTGRSALLWFFLGIFFNIITAIVLVVKTERPAS
jgi:hypothetical protein